MLDWQMEAERLAAQLGSDKLRDAHDKLSGA